jgi:2-phospho-L-lactate guanylyltransferase
MTESADFTWTVVVPVKILGQAKSRLASLAGPRRPELALAFASDTVSAVMDCPVVARVLVVTSDAQAGPALSSLGALTEPDPVFIGPDASQPERTLRAPGTVKAGTLEGGLNAALAHGAAVAARRWPGGGIAALTADLPALRPAELGRALTTAGQTARLGGPASSFVPDAAYVGTTMYAVAPWGVFAPGFGGASRMRHAAGGASELLLPGIPGLRRDVDTPDDLREAVALGTGWRTAALAGELLAAGTS